MKTTPFLLAVLLLAACHSKPAAENRKAAPLPNNHTPAESAVDPGFRAFIGKFKILQLPLSIIPGSNDSGLASLGGKDTNYLSNYLGEGISMSGYGLYAYGLLADTANSYKVIWLTPMDYDIPVLTTYTKNGKKLNEEILVVGECGSDCCYECDQIVTINKDLSIYSADSIKECQCDDNGPKLETMRKYVKEKTAKIAADGKFKFTEISEKNY
jgi:hypothetical protein